MFRCIRCQAEYPIATRFCWGCLSMDTIILAPRRRAAAIDGEAEVATARDLVKRTWNSVDVEAVAPGLRVQPGALIVVKGAPGAGKSTFALKLGNLSKSPVILLSAEERLGATVGERLSRLGIHREDLIIIARASVDQLVELTRHAKAHTIVVDSLQATTMTASDCRGLINKLRLDLMIVVSQVTKENDIRGQRDTEHEADVIIDIDGGHWSVQKSRYGPTGTSGVIQEVMGR